LRDVLRLSREDAKAIIAKGWAGLQRDAGSPDRRDAESDQAASDLLDGIKSLTGILKGE